MTEQNTISAIERQTIMNLHDEAFVLGLAHARALLQTTGDSNTARNTTEKAYFAAIERGVNFSRGKILGNQEIYSTWAEILGRADNSKQVSDEALPHAMEASRTELLMKLGLGGPGSVLKFGAEAKGVVDDPSRQRG